VLQLKLTQLQLESAQKVKSRTNTISCTWNDS